MEERCYHGEKDGELMLELVHRSPAEHIHLIDLPYRLSSWALGEPENTRLWFDEEGILRAWAVLQLPFWFIDYAFDPAGDRGLHCQILDWAVRRAQKLERNCWFVNVLDTQVERMADLEAKGFADQFGVPVDAWSKVFMMRPAEAPLPQMGALPSGYRLRALNGLEEVAAYVSLHQEVFQSKNMNADWREQVVRQLSYQPELNLVIEAPDASLAGFCIGWFDPAGYGGRPGGQIEPLGVSEQQRGLGLARHLLAECFRRMHALGAEQIYVETDNFRDAAFRLYEAAGFRVQHQVHVFRKDF